MNKDTKAILEFILLIIVVGGIPSLTGGIIYKFSASPSLAFPIGWAILLVDLTVIVIYCHYKKIQLL